MTNYEIIKLLYTNVQYIQNIWALVLHTFSIDFDTSHLIIFNIFLYGFTLAVLLLYPVTTKDTFIVILSLFLNCYYFMYFEVLNKKIKYNILSSLFDQSSHKREFYYTSQFTHTTSLLYIFLIPCPVYIKIGHKIKGVQWKEHVLCLGSSKLPVYHCSYSTWQFNSSVVKQMRFFQSNKLIASMQYG